MMVGDTEVRSIDECRGSFSSSQSSAACRSFGSGDSTSRIFRDVGRRDRRQLAEVGAGGFIEAHVGRHSPTLATAPARWTMRSFERNRAVAGDAVGDQLDAARDLFERLHRCVLHLAADSRHAAAFGEAVLRVDLVKCSFTMKPDPTPEPPSSPDSARKITSRSSGTFSRLSSSISSARRSGCPCLHGAAAVDVAAFARRLSGGCVHFVCRW